MTSLPLKGDGTMRWIEIAVAAALVGGFAGSAAAGEGKARTFPFARGDVGKVPAGWKAAQTNKGAGSVWKVVEDETAPSKTGRALAQTADSPAAVFNLCVA